MCVRGRQASPEWRGSRDWLGELQRGRIWGQNGGENGAGRQHIFMHAKARVRATAADLAGCASVAARLAYPASLEREENSITSQWQ
jgi:hypothetical protein